MNKNSDLDLEEVITGGGYYGASQYTNKVWRLTIYGSGNTKLEALSGGMGSDNYNDKEFWCNKDVFVVTKPNWDNTWEKPVADIKLTVGSDCKEEEETGKKECSINIAEGVDLKWNPNFKSKVIFLS